MKKKWLRHSGIKSKTWDTLNTVWQNYVAYREHCRKNGITHLDYNVWLKF